MTAEQRKRTKWVFMALILLFSFIILRVTYVNFAMGPRLERLRQAQYKRIINLTARRGIIRDVHGSKLAMDVTFASVYAVPTEVRNKIATADTLSRLTGVSKAKILGRLSRPKEFVWIQRRVPDNVAAAVKRANMRGVGFIDEPRRVYPNGSAAAAVVGFMGVDSGVEGVERNFEKYLRGRDGVIQMERDAIGRNIPNSISRREPVSDGHDIYLTIDLTIQHFAEQQLRDTVKEFNAKNGTAVVLDVKTGKILAMANYPEFDPNHFSEFSAETFRNRAISYVHEPGSTFKMVAAAAALDRGLLAPKQKRYFCGGTMAVGSKIIHDSHSERGGHGQISIDDIIRESCNVGVAQLAMTLGEGALREYIHRFGFGVPTGIELKPEERGIDPPRNRAWSNLTMATVSFGQGISVTPIQLAMAYGAIANGGLLMRPSVIDKITKSDGTVVEKFQPRVVRRVMSARAAEQMKTVLRSVVSNGTGASAEIEQYGSVGKTGTSQMVVNGRYASGKYVSSFIGFAPLDDPRILVLVSVTESHPIYYGGTVAAPAFKNIAQRTLWELGVAPTMHAMTKPRKSTTSKD